ncbi:MAG: hypothetical protein ACTSO6_09240 [Promethearchaeota archaeon]
MSDPSISYLGFREKGGWYLPLMISTSEAFTEATWTFTNTSLSLGIGFSTSLNCRTSGGPYFVHTIAFMRIPLYIPY